MSSYMSAEEWNGRMLEAKAWLEANPNATPEEKKKHRIPGIDNVRTQGWMWTIPVEGEHAVPREKVNRILGSVPDAAVYSEESGSKTGYRHFQAFAFWKNKAVGSQVRALFGRGIHVEPTRSTTEACATYCSKEFTHIGGPWWLGDYMKVPGMRPKKEQKERRDRYDALMEQLEAGRRYEDLLLDPEWRGWALRHSNAIRDLTSARSAERYGAHDREVSCDYVWGPAGSGKTSAILDLYGRRDTFIADLSSAFPFDGYEGQEVLLLDDFRGGIPFSELLRVLDRYPLRVNIKGAHTWACWTKVVISANIRIEKQYHNLEEGREPLYRRFERGIVFEKPDPSTPLPYTNREDAMIGKRNDGGKNGMPGFKPAWERTEEEAADAAIDGVFDSMNNA